MSAKNRCSSYKWYESKPHKAARMQRHIAPCDRGRHDGLHGNEELGMEWE